MVERLVTSIWKGGRDIKVLEVEVGSGIGSVAWMEGGPESPPRIRPRGERQWKIRCLVIGFHSRTDVRTMQPTSASGPSGQLSALIEDWVAPAARYVGSIQAYRLRRVLCDPKRYLLRRRRTSATTYFWAGEGQPE